MNEVGMEFISIYFGLRGYGPSGRSSPIPTSSHLSHLFNSFSLSIKQLSNQLMFPSIQSIINLFSYLSFPIYLLNNNGMEAKEKSKWNGNGVCFGLGWNGTLKPAKQRQAQSKLSCVGYGPANRPGCNATKETSWAIQLILSLHQLLFLQLFNS